MIKIFNKEQGFVLVVALVFLIALTAVASALMLNTTSDMKMSGASQEKVIAMQQAVGAVDEVIRLQNNNLFLQTVLPALGLQTPVTPINTVATVTIPNNNGKLPDCPHMKGSDDTDTKCNMIRVAVVKSYGNNLFSTITVNAGIAKQMNGL